MPWLTPVLYFGGPSLSLSQVADYFDRDFMYFKTYSIIHIHSTIQCNITCEVEKMSLNKLRNEQKQIYVS